MALADRLADCILSTQYSQISQETLDWARAGILDTVGCTLAGAREGAPMLAAAALGIAAAPGPCLVFGGDRRVDPLSAALVNGTAAHALDYDDCSNSMGGHPSAPILPALFAIGEQSGASGRDLLSAYVTGFEVEARMGRAVNLHHYEKGWHPTATLGGFGVTAACAKLLGLDAQRTAIALSIAASFASGVKSNFGSMVKPLHVGHCSRNGMYAALLAREGFTSGAEVFEHKQGFLNVFNGPGTYDVSRLFDGWGTPFDMVNPGIGFKQYPCCASTHPAIDCMMELRRTHDLRPEQVTLIESWTHKRRLEHTNRPHPRSALDAKFSVQYCLARALLHGAVSIDHFEGDAWRDAAVQALLQKVRAGTYTEAQFPPDNHLGAEVRVTLADGRVVCTKVDQAHGRDARSPLSADMLKAKFFDCAARVLPQARIEKLYEAIQGFEQLSDIAEMTALIDTASGTQKKRKRAAG
jgi:2-methylcitrate dehydratase PrpD